MIQSSANATNFSILCKGGEKSNCLFPLQNRPIGIGTDPDNCAIVYSENSRGIEPFHCQLVLENDVWTLTDFSNSGTWLNGQKMVKFQHYPLKVGDVFYLASPENTYELRGENSSANADSSVNLRKHVPLSQTQHVQRDDNAGNPNFNNASNPNFNNAGNSGFNNANNPNFNNAGNVNNSGFQVGMTQTNFPPQGQTKNPNSWQNQTTQSTEFGIKEKFLSYKGRLDRKTYIIRGFYLSAANAIIWLLSSIILTVFKLDGAILLLLFLVCLVPGLMLSIRRLHDVDKSGWYNLLNIVPIANFYVLYLLLVEKGTPGPNRFGTEYHYQAPSDSTQRELEEKFLAFEGRLNREPYILRQLCLLGASIVIGFFVAFILSLLGAPEDDVLFITEIAIGPFIYPFPLLTIRRLHDVDNSGWFYLIMLIPVINLIFLIYLLFKKGTPGPNRFGPDPLNQFP